MRNIDLGFLAEAINPSAVCWNKQNPPECTGLDDKERIAKTLNVVKSLFYSSLIKAVRFISANGNQSSIACHTAEEQRAWILALGSKLYGATYFLSRYEVNDSLGFARKNANLLNELDGHLAETGNPNQYINLAMHLLTKTLNNAGSLLRLKIPNLIN